MIVDSEFFFFVKSLEMANQNSKSKPLLQGKDLNNQDSNQDSNQDQV